MKYELPIAIVLLAAGGLLWGGQAQRLATMVKSRAPTPILPAKVTPRLDFSEIQPSREAVAMLKSLGRSYRNSAPLKMDILIEVNRSETGSQITGEYLQAGQGSGQSKLNLQLGSSANPLSISKICDGRFLYTHIRQGDHQTLEFVDLRRVQETRLSSGLAQPNNPTSWIATGGLASLFENLAAAFQFNPPVIVDEDGNSICTLEGIWQSDHLAELLHETVDPNDLKPKIQWDKIPQQIPHQVSIELVDLPGFGWTPRRILFLRFEKFANAPSPKNLAMVSFTEPQSIVVDENDFLELKTNEIETIDATDLYVNQIRTFGYARNAEAESQTLFR